MSYFLNKLLLKICMFPLSGVHMTIQKVVNHVLSIPVRPSYSIENTWTEKASMSACFDDLGSLVLRAVLSFLHLN